MQLLSRCGSGEWPVGLPAEPSAHWSEPPWLLTGFFKFPVTPRPTLFSPLRHLLLSVSALLVTDTKTQFPKVAFPGSRGTGILRVLHVPSSTQSLVKLLGLVSMASESTCHQLSSEEMWVTLRCHLVPQGPCQPVIPFLFINPWPCSVYLHLLQPRGPPEECSGHFWMNSV